MIVDQGATEYGLRISIMYRAVHLTHPEEDTLSNGKGGSSSSSSSSSESSSSSSSSNKCSRFVSHCHHRCLMWSRNRHPSHMEYRCTEVFVYICAGVPVYRCAAVPVSQCLVIPDYPCTSIWVYRCHYVPVYLCLGVLMR